MRKVLLLSPHFDDAVLSAGQLLAGRPDADVVTVFAGIPVEVHLTPYDKKCGFTSSKQAVEMRRIEDKNALALLGANPIHWNFTDGQYAEVGQLWDNLQFSIANEIMKQVEKEDYEYILLPLGLGHSDHMIILEAVYDLIWGKHLSLPVYVWEDLPLRVVEPELVPDRLAKFGIKEKATLGDGPIADKIRALSCYKSQIGTGILDPYVMYVPERFWRVNPNDNSEPS